MTLLRILVGDALATLRTLPAQHFHCVVTSPPYWGLRNYGVPGQLGLEPTPEAFIARMVEVFAEVRRVLRDDGVCWLNIGDCYAGSRKGPHDGVIGGRTSSTPAAAEGLRLDVPIGLKPGDQVGIPWRLAFALQADGWFLRSDVIWAKPNPMPESVAGWRWERCRVKVRGGLRGDEARRAVGPGRPQQDHAHGAQHSEFAPSAEWAACPGCPKCENSDGMILRRGSWRPTKAHEFLFLMAKSADYFCDGEAVKEASVSERPSGNGFKREQRLSQAGRGSEAPWEVSPTRNLRSVWEIGTLPFKEAHFATFPPELAERCIRAATSERGCCGTCAAPWVRLVERQFIPQQDVSPEKGRRGAGTQKPMDESNGWEGAPRGTTLTTSLGWRPSCTCATAPQPCRVLDPFGGAGTTGLVARRLGRAATLIELNPKYAEMAERRITSDQPLLNGGMQVAVHGQ